MKNFEKAYNEIAYPNQIPIQNENRHWMTPVNSSRKLTLINSIIHCSSLVIKTILFYYIIFIIQF